MQCSRTFLFQMCLSLLASMGSCTCKPTDNEVGRSEGSEEAARLQRESLQRLEQELVGLGEDDASLQRLEQELVLGEDDASLQRLEQELVLGEDDASLQRLEQELVGVEDARSRLESLLGTMKEGFLRKLNLSDVPQESAKIQPPQFMMELYNKYASNSTAIPQSDVIRSFTVQDTGLSWRNGSLSGHRLLFNVSLPGHEKVTAAELRLFLACRGRRPGSTATVRVYEVEDREEGLHQPAAAHHLLEGKEVTGSSSSWEMLDVTRAVRSWVRSGLVVNQLEVVVDGPSSCGVDVSTSIGDNSSAALIVFSDDLGSRRRETKKELKEMILHEEAAILYSSGRADATEGAEPQLPNELPEEEAELPRPRRRRRRKAEPREYCRRTSLKVNFKDIGWDSWIVAPPEYDAFECRGLCYHPLTDESTPSKHALIQTLVNILNPRRANMACCVPIRLDPITVMYQENGRLTIRYLYEEMKVAECGCR